MERVIATINTLHEDQEDNLFRSLGLQEKRRTIYWKEFDPFVNVRMIWRASLMRHLFHILPGQRILEIGAGNGKFTRALIDATRGECEVTSVIFSPEYANEIKRALDGRKAKIMYLDSFPGALEEGRFDYIVAHHMLEDESRNAFLYRAKSLLKPGGGILLFEPNPWNPYYRLRRLIKKFFPIRTKRPTETVYLNRLQIFSILSELGYIKINALPYDFLYAPVPRFLLWPAQHLSLILENFPYVRNFAGSLYIWAYQPTLKNHKNTTMDLCEHTMFLGKVSFIVPCHNEEMNILPLVEGILDFYGKYVLEIIIVDDNSQDRTAQVAEEIIRRDNRVRLIRRNPPNGVGRALKDGLLAAGGEYILTMDCDFLQLLPEMRDLFSALAQGADIAVGSRFSRDSVLLNYAFTKIVANRFFHLLANLLFRKRFRDISNNLKLFRRKIAEDIVIECDDFAANAEIGLKAILSGFCLVEVPISWVNRSISMGLSTFRILKTGPNYMKLLFRLAWIEKFGFRRKGQPRCSKK